MRVGAEGGAPAKVGKRSHVVFYATAVLVFVLDQFSKWAVRQGLPPGASRPVLGRFLSLTHHHNTGAAFGLVPNWTIPLIILAVVVVIVLVVYGPRAALQSRVLSVGLALQLGGAAGNLHDRLRLGHVIDFIDFHFWPVFNTADAAITCGAGIIVYSLITAKSDGRGASADP
ncbi:MAG: signal peptidase II [Armatimonadota bacterium]